MTKFDSISERLENWGRAQRFSVGRGQHASMTGLICDRLRRAALGNVWSGMEPAQEIDEKDAELVERAWRGMLVFRRKQLLRMHFVRRWPPDAICHHISIKRRTFDVEMWRSLSSIETILDKIQFAVETSG